jgi:group I intron endonuclease
MLVSERVEFAPDDVPLAPRTIGVYAIVCLNDGRAYVGSAARMEGFRTRWMEHRRDLDTKTSPSAKLQRAWTKYGRDAFVFRILETIERADSHDETRRIVLAAEERHILAMDAVASGFNIRTTPNSNLGIKISDEHRARLRARVAADPEWQARLKVNASRKRSDESKLKASERFKALHADPEFKAKHSASIKESYIKRGGMSEEHRAALSVARKGKKLSEAAKANQSAAQQAAWDSEERRAGTSARMKELWSNPEFMERMRAERSTRRHSPETLEKMRAAQKARYADPVERERMKAAQQAGAKAHREAQRGGDKT